MAPKDLAEISPGGTLGTSKYRPEVDFTRAEKAMRTVRDQGVPA